MFRDKSLMPNEAVRLAALGLLSDEPKSYARLADEVRHFTTRYWGQTLDVMASSIELLRFEGLIETTAKGETLGDAMVGLTDKGRAELHELMRAAVRAPAGDFSKLVIALKLRFLHLLPASEQREQTEALIESSEAELARLRDLRAAQADEGGPFARWLDHDIARTEADVAWFQELRRKLDDD